MKLRSEDITRIVLQVAPAGKQLVAQDESARPARGHGSSIHHHGCSI